MAVRSANAYDSIYSELNQMPIRLETSLPKFGKMNFFFPFMVKFKLTATYCWWSKQLLVLLTSQTEEIENRKNLFIDSEI